jgi:hypothetical protein
MNRSWNQGLGFKRSKKARVRVWFLVSNKMNASYGFSTIRQGLWCLRVQENNKIEWHKLKLQKNQVRVDVGLGSLELVNASRLC